MFAKSHALLQQSFNGFVEILMHKYNFAYRGVDLQPTRGKILICLPPCSLSGGVTDKMIYELREPLLLDRQLQLKLILVCFAIILLRA